MRIESLPAYCETHRGRTDQTLRALPLKLCRAGAGPGEVAGGPWRVERVGPSLTRSCRGAPHWWERVPPDVSPGSGQSTARSLQPIARRVSLGWAPYSGGPQLESQQCPALFHDSGTMGALFKLVVTKRCKLQYMPSRSSSHPTAASGPRPDGWMGGH